jgi:hypothetical protein
VTICLSRQAAALVGTEIVGCHLRFMVMLNSGMRPVESAQYPYYQRHRTALAPSLAVGKRIGIVGNAQPYLRAYAREVPLL